MFNSVRNKRKSNVTQANLSRAIFTSFSLTPVTPRLRQKAQCSQIISHDCFRPPLFTFKLLLCAIRNIQICMHQTVKIDNLRVCKHVSQSVSQTYCPPSDTQSCRFNVSTDGPLRFCVLSLRQLDRTSIFPSSFTNRGSSTNHTKTDRAQTPVKAEALESCHICRAEVTNTLINKPPLPFPSFISIGKTLHVWKIAGSFCHGDLCSFQPLCISIDVVGEEEEGQSGRWWWWWWWWWGSVGGEWGVGAGEVGCDHLGVKNEG